MKVSLPAYLICGPDFAPNVYHLPDGRDCFLVFAMREHAEMFVLQYTPSSTIEKIDPDDLTALSMELPHVPLILWQATVRCRECLAIPTEQFREPAERHRG